MFNKRPPGRALIFILILASCLNLFARNDDFGIDSSITSGETDIITLTYDSVMTSQDVRLLNDSLRLAISLKYYDRAGILTDKILSRLDKNNTERHLLAESYYYIGIYFLYVDNYSEAVDYLNLFTALKADLNEYDDRLATAYYNIGIAYSRSGDYKRHAEYTIRSLDLEKKLFGESSPKVISTSSSLIIALINLKEYDKAIPLLNSTLKIASIYPDSVSYSQFADLYSNFGTVYARISDYSKAKIYFDKAELIYREHQVSEGDNFINLINNLAVSYGALHLTRRSDQYYEEGIRLAKSSNSTSSYNLVNSYAIILGNKGSAKRGAKLLHDALVRAGNYSGQQSRTYTTVLSFYADYLREYNINNDAALSYYKQCIGYLKDHGQDNTLKTAVYTGYALSLAMKGQSASAIEVIQSLLFPEGLEHLPGDRYDNPPVAKLNADGNTLKLLKTKYKVLWDLYGQTSNENILIHAANTAELIINVLEKVRINISEEDSRLLLGNKYRDLYLNAIRDFNLLYSQTGDIDYLEKAFEYSEKSKVAGLLTSTRELKAVQFNIPQKTADYEMELKRDITLYNSYINGEGVKENPDSLLLRKWNDNLIETFRLRDSLVRVFEQKYPDYYAIKYNTKGASMKDIPEIFGRNANYINYVLSDSILYTFVANRKEQHLLSRRVDSSFFNSISNFRKLLEMPLPNEDAGAKFRQFNVEGINLYKALIEPVRPFLISDKIIISPDNLLSYIPFEALPDSPYHGEKDYYNAIHYLMDDYDISYTYSATFIKEMVKRRSLLKNSLIAFAPDYIEPIHIQTVMNNRQEEGGILPDLPWARKEAEFVSKLTGGKLYENNNASESTFRAEAGNYDIIHLAMHTLINDRAPMYSKLIFSPENDTIEDGYLNTYEVYGIPLKAKMVVLSSCNTGTGVLFTGEGILSLARGFIYSGSQSVVMSMWEIEDKSGTIIVDMFYENLKRGYSKSQALRKARINYLKNADQLRAHPYFWSSMIIYGDNAPLYYNRLRIAIGSVIALILAGAIIFYLKRR